MVANHGIKKIKSPGSLVLTGYVGVPDISKKTTPDLKNIKNTSLLYIDLSPNVAINTFIEKNNELQDKFKLQKYLSKFRSRYNAKLSIEGDRPSNYKIKAKLDGYLDVSKNDYKNNKEKFYVDLEGGLLRGKGKLKIKKLPLSATNIFLNQPKDFLGGLDINLDYDLDKKSFFSEIYDNNSSLKNNQIVFREGKIDFVSSYFDIDFDHVFYLTDTGRRWDGFNVSVRDKVKEQKKWTDIGFCFRSTDDIIEKLLSNDFPNHIMFNFHPQRWNVNFYPWLKELIIQNLKNQVKRSIVLKRKLRYLFSYGQFDGPL